MLTSHQLRTDFEPLYLIHNLYQSLSIFININMPKQKVVKFAILILLLVWIDLISKYFFYNLQILKWDIIQPSFNLGIAWSISIPLAVTILISLTALVIFWVFYIRWYINTVISWFLIAGTLWNLIDRIFLWWVRDFINIWVFHFPVFNFADTFLTVWITLFVLNEILSYFCPNFFLEKKN